MKTGIEIIKEERERQVSNEGWTSAHDDAHENGEMSDMAACFAAGRNIYELVERSDYVFLYKELFPFDSKWDKRGKHNRLRELAKAGALIAAEIDRILRIEES